jgi:ATP-dependent Lon protease
MQESARTAVSWVRANAARFGLPADVLRGCDLHVHVPAGAVPKDGPSAGVVIVTSLVSLLTGRSVRPYVAATGEITLSGVVLPVGGIKEKVLAARRSGVRELVLPRENEPNLLDEVPAHLRGDVAIRFAGTMDEAIELVLEEPITNHEAIMTTSVH